MPIDQIIWILLASILVNRGTKAFSEMDGARVVWIDVTHQCLQFALLKGPIAHRDRGFKSISLAFGFSIELPSKFRFRETGALVDLNLSKALLGLSQLN